MRVQGLRSLLVCGGTRASLLTRPGRRDPPRMQALGRAAAARDADTMRTFNQVSAPRDREVRG